MEMTPEINQMLQEIFIQQGNQEKALKLERFRRLNPLAKKGQILFCGSSLMEQFPIHELLWEAGSPLVIYNRGVGGFTTAEMAQALEPCVFQLEPRHIFINIGTNDLNGPDYALEGLMARYQGILDQIKSRLPEARLHLLAYYPVNEKIGLANPNMAEVFRHRTNARIAQANQGVQALAEKNAAGFHDFNACITDSEGNMKAQYTIEGMHMYPDGYRQIFQAMLPILEQAGQDCGP